MAIRILKKNSNASKQELASQLFRSLYEAIVENKLDNDIVSKNSFDSLLSEHPALLKDLNNRVYNSLVKEGHKAENIPQIEYSEPNDENGKRVLNLSNSGCKYYTCDDMIMYCYSQCPGLVDYINYRSGGEICPIQFPSAVCRDLSATVIPEGAMPADVSNDYVVDAVPTAASYILCQKLEIPGKYGMLISITQERMLCDMCIDIMQVIMLDFPRRIKKTQNDQILSLITAGASFPLGTSNILEVIETHETELNIRKVSSSNIVSMMSRAAFNQLKNLKNSNGNFIFPNLDACPADTCEICLQGHRIIIVDQIPVGGVAGANTSQVISGDLSVVVARGTDPLSCEYNETNSCESSKIYSMSFRFQAAIPLNLAGKFLSTNITF